MSEEAHACPQCGRKIIQSISNRCMYCGADLPEEHHLDQEGKSRLLAEKLERFRQTEENADQIISNMRRDFAIPDPKISRKQRKQSKQDNAAAVAAAIASINTDNDDGNEDGGSSR